MTDLTDLKVLAQNVLDIKEHIQLKKDAIEAARQAVKDLQADLSEGDLSQLRSANLALKAVLATLDSKFGSIVLIDLGSKALVCEQDSDGNWCTNIAHKL